MQSIPDIIAHRGASREALENTLAAFELALEQGADGIELDVHATRDGTVFVHHDPDLRWRDEPRVVARAIAELDTADVRGHRLESVLGVAHHVPALDDVLDLVGDRATVYIEVKAAGIEAPLVAVLARHPAARVAVHSFDHRIPVAVRRVRSGTAIGLLSASYPLDLARFIGAAQPDAFWQQAHLIDDALVADAHALGARIIAWTENDPAHARELIEMGVDALCTDTPGVMRAALLAQTDRP